MIATPLRFIRVLKSVDLEIWAIPRQDWPMRSNFKIGAYIVIEDLGRPSVVGDYYPWLSERDKADFEPRNNLVVATIISRYDLESDLKMTLGHRIESDLLEHVAMANCDYIAHFQLVGSFNDLESDIAKRIAKAGFANRRNAAWERLTQIAKPSGKRR